MYFQDHNPPHFHAEYNDFEALIEIESGEVLRGSLPSKQLKYVQVWTDIHQKELMRNFELLSKMETSFFKIKPI